jgi:hypothetical protein
MLWAGLKVGTGLPFSFFFCLQFLFLFFLFVFSFAACLALMTQCYKKNKASRPQVTLQHACSLAQWRKGGVVVAANLGWRQRLPEFKEGVGSATSTAISRRGRGDEQGRRWSGQ